MNELFTQLAEAVSGSPGTALAAAFVWGVLSVALSPCHLASLPLIVAFISGQSGGGRGGERDDEQGRGRSGARGDEQNGGQDGEQSSEQGRNRSCGLSTRRALGLSTLFALGMLVTIAALGVMTAAAGRMLGDIGAWANYIVALIFVLVGLHLWDIIPAPWSGPGKVGLRKRGAGAAFLLGLFFGIALGPCTFAFMAPVLALSFGMGAGNPVWGALLLIAYGIGHSLLIVLAGGLTEQVQRYLDWNEKSRGTLILRRVCGVLVVAGGLYLIWAS